MIVRTEARYLCEDGDKALHIVLKMRFIDEHRWPSGEVLETPGRCQFVVQGPGPLRYVEVVEPDEVFQTVDDGAILRRVLEH